MRRPAARSASEHGGRATPLSDGEQPPTFTDPSGWIISPGYPAGAVFNFSGAALGGAGLSLGNYGAVTLLNIGLHDFLMSGMPQPGTVTVATGHVPTTSPGARGPYDATSQSQAGILAQRLADAPDERIACYPHCGESINRNFGPKLRPDAQKATDDAADEVYIEAGMLVAGEGVAAVAWRVVRGLWALRAAASATRASVTDKLARYLLNAAHAVGGPKAKWFEQALGFTQSNSGELSRQIVFDAAKAVQTGVTQHGTKFNQVIPIKGANGRVIDVTFAWIRNNDGVVRLVTAIPTKL